jgi:hypothetical protein
MKRTFMAMTVLLAVLTGCQKENRTVEKKKVKKAELFASLVTQSGITRDIRDSVGLDHNRALTSLIEYSKMNGGINRDECFIFLDQYYMAPSNVNRADNYRYAKMVLSKQPIDSDGIIIQMSYSQATKQLLQTIIDITLQQQELNLQLLNEKLAALESKARQRLKGEELSVALQLSSISRHSAKFWKTYYIDHPRPVGEGLWKVLAAIHADNCGFLVGVLFGDPGFWSAYFSATVGFSILDDRKVEI